MLFRWCVLWLGAGGGGRGLARILLVGKDKSKNINVQNIRRDPISRLGPPVKS